MMERNLRPCLLLAGLAIACASFSFGQDNSDWEAWRGVNRIRGVATAVDLNSRYEVTDSYISDTNAQATSVYRFVLMPEETIPNERVPLTMALLRRSEAVSVGWVQIECQAAGMENRLNIFTTKSDKGSTSVTSHFSGPLAADSLIQFSIHLKNGTWDCSVPGDLQNPYAEHIHGEGSLPDYNHDEVREVRRGLPVFLSSMPLPKKPGYISGKFDKDIPTKDQPETKFHRLMKFELWPEFEDVELEIKIDDLEKWRPLGNIGDSHLAGTHLPVKATLKPKGGKLALTLTPKRFIFKLLDTSREPGVCMNWPLGAKDRDRDLKLAADIAFPDNTLDGEGQTLEIRDRMQDAEGHFTAGAHIDSFDFGARAELRVTCELSDGREIVGVVKAPEGDQDIVSLPKGLRDGDWIPATWRKENNAVGLPDNDDSETDPKGDKSAGDGYTLYEEYRGFVENGQRIEGDPKKKDFFVQNLVGDKANAGIALFSGLSQLIVHDKLRAGEMSGETRLMNGNHRDAPHRVDQHGVWIKEFSVAGLGVAGAAAVGTQDRVSLRPGLTKGIGIAAPNDPKAIFTKAFNLSAGDQATTYKRAIAHELLHSVGVNHHGKGDYTLRLSFLNPESKKNPLHKPIFRSGDGTLTTLLSESGEDRAIAYYAKYKEARDWLKKITWSLAVEQAQSMLDSVHQTEPSAEEIADQIIDSVMEGMLAFDIAVGVEKGEDSGDQNCVMRYYFSNAYPAHGRKSTYYVTEPGTEPIGQTLCHSSQGTGINGAEHAPQSRYGDASGGLGNCTEQICPNDAVPPRKP